MGEFCLKKSRSGVETIKDLITCRLFPRSYGYSVIVRKWDWFSLQKAHSRRIRDIRKAGKARVFFVVSQLAMWRLDDVFRILKEDGRFDAKLVICPFSTFSPEQRKTCVEELIAHCRKTGWNFLDKSNYENSADLITEFQPDIIFYPQLYEHLFNNELDCEKNLDRLIAYVPYGLPTVSGEWMYNSRFMNTVWKLYFPTALHLKYARKHSFNRARNMEIVGDPHAAAFSKPDHQYGWKNPGAKRIIWAPHFSVIDEGHLHRASFLDIHQLMWDLAQLFKNETEFVFKPHPRLLSELYRHPDWGKARTDAYFALWENGENTQLETGTYVDLFCTSDALIHDCGSFTAEYLYTGKPVLFVSPNFRSVYEGLDTFGSLCLDLHYQARNASDIQNFLKDVVLNGNDPKKKERETFRKRYLPPDYSSSFAQNVFHSLTKSLFR